MRENKLRTEFLVLCALDSEGETNPRSQRECKTAYGVAGAEHREALSNRGVSTGVLPFGLSRVREEHCRQRRGPGRACGSVGRAGGGHPRPPGLAQEVGGDSEGITPCLHLSVHLQRRDGPATVSPGGLHAGVTAILARGRGPLSGSH